MSETERAVLSLTMEDSSLFHKAVGLGLTSRHFGSIANRILWDTIREMTKKQIPIDLITTRDYLTDRGKLERIGGVAYLSSLDLELPDPAHIAAYVDGIKAVAVRRKTVDIGKRLARLPEGELSVDQILGGVQEGVNEITSLASDTLRVTTVEVAINKLVEQLEDGLPPGLDTGFPSLDALLGGCRPGNLVIVAGRPGMGKTAVACNMMQHQAEAGVSAGMFSLEMSSQELSMRMLSGTSRVPHQKIKMNALGSIEWTAIAKARSHIATLPIVIEDSGGLDIDKLTAKATEMKNVHQLGVIYVDYIQLMSPPPGDRSGNRVKEISDITRGLKNLARKLEIPIVALSQLSREVEKRANKRPQLSDLRDSGSIEQDADSVIFMFRKGYYMTMAQKIDTTNGVTEVNVAKNRSGPPGTIHLQWDSETGRFLNP